MRPYDLYKERRLFLLYLTLGGSGGGGGAVVETTVTGISPLALVNAVADELVSLTRTGKVEYAPKTYVDSLTQYGKVIQNGTPTPDAPVDLVCNNGALRMVHRSGLPSGYKLLEYVGGNGARYVITDLYLASTDVVECEFRNSATTGYGAVYGVFKLGESSALYGNQTYYGYDAANDKVNTGIPVDTEWHSARHDFVNGTLTVDDTTVTFTPFEFVNSTQNAVLSRYYSNSYGYNWKGYVRKFKVTRNGEVVCDLLPAKNSNDVAGLYDLITGNFYTATGGDLLEGDEIDDYEFRIVGASEVLSVGGLNLFYNDEAWEQGFYLTSGKVASATANRTFVMRCSPNTTYYWKHCSLVGGVRAFTVDDDTVENGVDGTWIKQNPVIGEINEVYSATTGANAKWLCVCFGRNEKTAAPIADQWSDFMLSTIPLTADTPYEPYCEPQTASVSNLYAVGDYKDEQDVISGAVNRKVGVKVLTGNEEWTAKDQYNRVSIVADDMINPASPRLIPAICTHYENLHNGEAISTVTVGQFYTAAPRRLYFHISEASKEEFTAFLAAQYAAGTPVIVMYPLAEETTESVTSQPIYNFTPDLNVYAAASVALTDSDFAKTSSSHTEPTPYAPLDLICNNGKIGESGATGPKEVVTVSPYGSTAVIEDLLAVGEYADTHEVVSGAVKRKVGVKVLDGTETWGQKNATDGRIIMRLNDAINQASAPIIVTHGQWSVSATKDSDEWRILAGPYLCCYSSLETTADFKAYLAAQYANGTPVIAIYPLAEETSTSVVNQDIELVDGTNTITTNSAISDAPISAVYKMRSS